MALADTRKRSWQDNAHVIPYFNEPVGSAAYASGFAIARNWNRLNHLADLLKLEPLSSFGFTDDWRGDTLVWHSASEALPTVRVLGQLIDSGYYDDWHDAPALVAELGEVERALVLAIHADTPFCFTLSITRWTCQSEHDQRLGSFF